MNERRTFVAGLAALAALVPLRTRAQIGCPPKCKCTRKKGCCQMIYTLAAGFCFRDHKECDSAAKRRCNDCGGRCD